MTDTTDITALRAESANLMILLHKEDLGVEVTLTAAKFFDDVFRLLEAESQRAERAKSALDSMTRQRDEVERLRVVLCDDKENLIDKCIERDKEIAALKGDQVPVGVYNYVAFCIVGSATMFSIKEAIKAGFVSESGELARNHAYLFTAPQKPVVWLGDIAIHDDLHEVGALVSYDDVVAAIEAAGGIVKDGEYGPVGVWCIQEVTDDDGSLSRTEFLSVTDGVKIPKDAPLFTAPQKPVVLPPLPAAIGDFTEAAMKAVRRMDIAAIEAAGGIVKRD